MGGDGALAGVRRFEMEHRCVLMWYPESRFSKMKANWEKLWNNVRAIFGFLVVIAIVAVMLSPFIMLIGPAAVGLQAGPPRP